jgi:hypothetical protein
MCLYSIFELRVILKDGGQKYGSMFSHCCKISKFENPILRLREAERIKESHEVPT